MRYVRFTARNVRPRTVNRIRGLAEANRTVAGAILDDAVDLLWDAAVEPEDDEDDDDLD